MMNGAQNGNTTKKWRNARMTKLKSAERIIRQNGDCTGICCDKCLLDNYCDVRTKDEDKLEQAKKYKEEHKMKEKFDLNNYKGKYVMHCKTEEEAKIFCKFLHDAGKYWFSGLSYIEDTLWTNADAVYFFNEDLTGHLGDTIELKGHTVLEFDDFDWKQEMKFKVGDMVKWNGSEKCIYSFIPQMNEFLNSKKVFEIEDICGDIINLVGDDCNYSPNMFELVESKLELIKGKRYEVSNNEDFSNSRERIFDSYDEGFKEPYRCVDCMFEDEYENKFCIETDSWKYIREIQPKYKAYTEPKIEWLDNKKVLDKDTGIEWDINYLGKDNKVTIGNEHEYSLAFMFEHFTWIDGTPFGEEIK